MSAFGRAQGSELYLIKKCKTHVYTSPLRSRCSPSPTAGYPRPLSGMSADHHHGVARLLLRQPNPAQPTGLSRVRCPAYLSMEEVKLP